MYPFYSPPSTFFQLLFSPLLDLVPSKISFMICVITFFFFGVYGLLYACPHVCALWCGCQGLKSTVFCNESSFYFLMHGFSLKLKCAHLSH